MNCKMLLQAFLGQFKSDLNTIFPQLFLNLFPIRFVIHLSLPRQPHVANKMDYVLWELMHLRKFLKLMKTTHLVFIVENFYGDIAQVQNLSNFHKV